MNPFADRINPTQSLLVHLVNEHGIHPSGLSGDLEAQHDRQHMSHFAAHSHEIASHQGSSPAPHDSAQADGAGH